MPDDLDTCILTPASCSVAQLRDFCELVNSGHPAADLSPERMSGHALKLAFVLAGHSLVAVGGLKRPLLSYRQYCFREAGVPDRWQNYPVEFGWVYCRQEFRGGMAHRILDPLLNERDSAGGLYAIVRAENYRMGGPLRKRGFKPIGGHYPSIEHPGEMVELLVREPC